MRMRLAVTAVLAASLAALAAVAGGCGSSDRTSDKTSDRSRATAGGGARAGDDVVARVGGIDLLASDVLRQMRFSGKPPREALDELIHFELLAAAAARAVSAHEPDVVEAAAGAAVSRLVAAEIEPLLGKDQIPESVLRDVYQKGLTAFVHPRLVEVAMLNVYTGPRMKDAPRARAAATARALETFLRQRAPQTQTGSEDFEAIAADPAWKERSVKFSRVWQGTDQPFPGEVGKEVQRLKAPGQTTPMVTAETGFHVARYLAERPPKNVPFEQARQEIADQIHERWKTGRFLELTAEMAGSHVIEAFPDRLAAASAAP